MLTALRHAVVLLLLALPNAAPGQTCDLPVTDGGMYADPPLPRPFTAFRVVVPDTQARQPWARLTAEATGRRQPLSTSVSYVTSIDVGPLPAGRYRIEYFDQPDAPKPADRAKYAMTFAVSSASPMRVVEYVSEAGQYFYTGFTAEIAALDAGEIPGWSRTGLSFLTLPPGEMPSNGATICRLLRKGNSGPLHVFADPTECAWRLAREPDQWVLETAAAFGLVPPAAHDDGSHYYDLVCGRPLWRLTRMGADPAYRLTTSQVVRNTLLKDGWMEHPAPKDMCVLQDVN